jgi:hypothetical protein
LVFAQGHYAPQSHAGRQLLAHELVHVVQQGGRLAPSALEIGPPDDRYEREAQAQSQRVAGMTATEPAPVLSPVAGAGAARLQRAFLGGALGQVGLVGGLTAAGALIGGLLGGVPGAVIGGLIGLAVGGIIALIGNLANSLPAGKLQMISGRYVGNVEGPLNNLKEEVLVAMDRLHLIGAMPDGDYSAEYPVVSKLPKGSSVPSDTIPKTITAIGRLSEATLNPAVARKILDLELTGNVGQGQSNNRADILGLQDALHVDWNLTDADYTTERAAVSGLATPTVPDTLIPKTVEGITKMKGAFTAGAIRRDLFVGTHAATETEKAKIEHLLNPTTTLVTPPAPVGGPPPPPTVVNPPPLTDGGPGGAFETEMLHMLTLNVGGWAKAFRSLKGEKGQPAFPIPSANNVAVAAQGEVERYFSPYLHAASRGPADTYHPGSYSLVTKLGDESKRPLTDDDRQGWMSYWMTLRGPDGCRAAPCGQDILDAHHFLGSRDAAELDRVRDVYMSTPANVTDIDDAIHSWPAEAGTGTVFIQPYERIPNETEKRKQRWRLFTTFIHEMMHVVEHPNFGEAANRIGGTGQKILVEGFAELMRTELWSGPGQLKGRLASSELAPLREKVEGTTYPYDAAVIEDAPYYEQLADAQEIDKTVGHENAKAAFFLGHVELLGLGAGTRTEAGSLAGIAMYEPSEVADAEVIVPEAGDTVATLLSLTGASPGGLLDDATGAKLPAAAPIAPGTRVRVPGIRWVRALANDTLGSVAQQNRVTVAALARANRFPAAAPASTPLVTGTRVLIPIHATLP